MWVFTKHGFYSAVSRKDGNIAVRARLKKHLEDLIQHYLPSKPEIVTTKESDYRHRIIIPHDLWVEAISKIAKDIDYGNFKSEVYRTQGSCDYETALHQIWETMYLIQK